MSEEYLSGEMGRGRKQSEKQRIQEIAGKCYK